MQSRLRRCAPGFVPAALLALLLAPNAWAEWKFVPGVTVRETYTDNVALDEDAKARSRWVTEIAPSFSLSNVGPRLKLRSFYQYRYYGYDDDGIEGARHGSSSLRADMQSMLIDDLLFFDADAGISQQAVSAFGPAANNNNYTNANRANVKTWRVSPYLKHKFGQSASGELRYSHDEVDSGGVGMRKSDSDIVLMSLVSGPAFRKFSWGLRYNQERLSYDQAGLRIGSLPNGTTKQASLNLAYRLLPTLSLTAGVGYDDYSYESQGTATKGRSHQAGFNWNPSSRTSLSLSAGKRYYGNTYFLQALHRSRRSVWNISYNESVSTARSQFLLPATIDTASTLDRLLTPTIADPAQRALAVAAYIRANNLPSSLAESINYFSNRFSLYKQFQASVAFNTARSTLILSAFDARQDALSALRGDSQLIGPINANINNNTRQRGGSVLYNYRLTGRSALNASYTKSHSESESAQLEADNAAARVGVQRQFSPRTRAEIEVRRTTGTTANRLATYRENAVSASLSMLF